jgi:hypothetical protein
MQELDSWRHVQSEDGTVDAHLIGFVRECQSPLDVDGDPVRVESMPREEWGDFLEYCGALGERFYDEDAGDDPNWRCARCGGARFEYRGVYVVSRVERLSGDRARG